MCGAVSSLIPSGIVAKTRRGGGSSPLFDALGWCPDGPVHGRCNVMPKASTDRLVFGELDVDSDGIHAQCTAT